MMEQIIKDVKERVISPTAGCIAILMLDDTVKTPDLAKMLDIPYGSASGVKSKYKRNQIQGSATIAKEYLDRITSPAKQLVNTQIETIDSWSIPPKIETKKEFSAPMVEPEKKSYEIALEKKKEEDKQQEKEVDPQYYKLIDHLNKFGLYEKIKDYAQDEKAVELLSVIVEFIEKNSNSSFRMPKIFTHTLKAVIDSSTIEEIKYLNYHMNALATFRDEVTMLESWVENLDGKVLDMFKSGNAEAMSKLYDEHKSTIAKFNASKERYKTVKEAVCKQTELVESILSAKIPTF